MTAQLQPAPARDPLTGLYGLGEARARLSSWAGQDRPALAMLIGLRRFDTVNLAYGANAGDAALVEVANRILRFAATEAGGEWLVARLGGGTFLFVTSERCSRDRWHWLAETLDAAISLPISNLGKQAAVRLWPRIAMMEIVPSCPGENAITALAETLKSLDDEPARRTGWVDGIDLLGMGHGLAGLEADLVNALDRDEIRVLYQGQHDAHSGQLVGAEALARWEHPELGRLGAEALFAIAARAQQSASLSRHIARQALSVAGQWSDPVRLSLNVTPADLASGSFAEEFVLMIRAARIAPERITVELTEQALLSDIDRSAAVLARIKAAGAKVALDDFGAGFCNFHYLKTLPLDYLKLDRSMVDGIASDPRDLAVFRGIVAMARALDLTVVAEGVETEEQRAVVAAEGCAIYQGFVSSRPMTAEAFADCLA